MRSILVTMALLALFAHSAVSEPPATKTQIGQEIAIPKHLADDEEFQIPLRDLIAYGKKLFCAVWTEQEGGGRPLTKGTGKRLADVNNPLVGVRAFNRVSGPDANSCAGCHNTPYGIAGGGGDFVSNVFTLGQRFDFVTFDRKDSVPTKGSVDEENKPITLQTVGNLRSTTGMFGAGYLEMLARQITQDLQTIRDHAKPGESKELISKGISFGRIARTSDGLWDTTQVEGLPWASLVSGVSNAPPSLIIRPWHQAGNVVSLREFTNTAFNQHHGIQSTERFGVDTDPDGDGFTNELTRADVTAATIFQATLQVPGRVIPNEPAIERAVLLGEKVFDRIACSRCHIPSLPLDKQGWMYSEPNPYNPPGNLRMGQTQPMWVDLTSSVLPQPRLKVLSNSTVDVPAYTDFKLHDICDSDDPGTEPLDMNRATWSPKFKQGNRKFLTKRLWGAANEPPYFHHGLFTTLRQALLAHSGEALKSRRAFEALPAAEQDALIEFLKTLQVLPPGTQELIVDENFHKKEWPPASEELTRLVVGGSGLSKPQRSEGTQAAK
jgi:cytochrome c5